MSKELTEGVQHNQPGMVKLIGVATFDAMGDPGVIDIPKVNTIAHDSVGAYTIELQDSYVEFHGMTITPLRAGAEVGVRFQVQEADVDNYPGGTIALRFYDFNSPGNLRNPISCDLYFEINLDNVPE